MPKYVCDFDTVIEIGKKVSEIAQTVKGDFDTYKTNVESDLSGWNSVAKNSFITTNTAQVVNGQAMATYADTVGTYIQTAAQKIQALEEDIAGQIQI